ncbi:MAG: hypothetical protein WB586_26415, partial [Chthoniobacterales bacterium]
AASAKLKATFHQTEQVLTVATRGPGFALDETLYLDGRTDPSNQQLLGATSLKTRTAWSNDYKQLVETHQIKTKQGNEGQLIIKRHLINDGKSMVVAFTLKLNAEPQMTSARQIWHKQAILGLEAQKHWRRLQCCAGDPGPRILSNGRIE